MTVVRRARFEPQRTDDLHSGAVEHIGKVYDWVDMGLMEEGQFAGSRIFLTREVVDPWLGWVPECDLVWLEERERKRG